MKEIKMSLKSHDLLNEYRKLNEDLDKRLKKELFPQMKECIKNKDIETLRFMGEITRGHSFSIRCYQAIVEINNKDNLVKSE